MIPAFDETTGLLAATTDGTGYECTADEVSKRFVEELGSPEWRVQLFEGWDLLRRGIRQLVPTARWWLWGCFVSNHPVPVFGDHERLSAVVLLPIMETPIDEGGFTMLIDFIRSAGDHHRVDAGFVFEYPAGHPDNFLTMAALHKFSERATKGFADHNTRELVPAGFLEVLP